MPTGTNLTLDAGLYLDAPIKVPNGYRFPSGNTTADSDGFVLIPVSVVPTTMGSFRVDEIQAKLSFDATRWKPVYNHSSIATVEQMFPTERLASAVPSGVSTPWTMTTYSAYSCRFSAYPGKPHTTRAEWAGRCSRLAGPR